MVSLTKIGHLGNYLEIILMEGETDMDIPDNVFFKMLQHAKNKTNSCFQKHYKEYVYRNLFYENNDKNQIKIYRKILTHVETIQNGMKLLVFHKEKLPYHVFPSTTTLHSVCYVSKAIIKINNRVFLNFEKKIYQGANDSNGSRVSFNKIYINYNHEQNVDFNGAESAINTCLQLIS